MTPRKLTCEAENCPFHGEPTDRRAMGLGEWSDRVVIAACGLIVSMLAAVIVWFGMKVDKLSDRVQALGEAQGVYLERLSSTGAETDRLRANQAQLRADFDALRLEIAKHERGDSARFASVRDRENR